MDDTMAIALFRHGMTEANKRHAYLGWTDSPLCPIEKGQLAEVAGRFEVLQSSDLGRCLETARIIFPKTVPETRPEWRELHFGEWEGSTYEELKDEPGYQKWLEDPFLRKLPGGESFAEFSARVDKGWEELISRMLAEDSQKAAVITHSGVIRYLLGKYAPGEKEFWEWRIPFGGGYEFVWPAEKLRRGERCTLLREVPLTENPSG